ncbi:MAG: thiol protease/hemagglutinin PrtT [Bacteroidales bacterium]|nr:thiol protease/hemagglutinin PrtT [Bacteroidales bacterium]
MKKISFLFACMALFFASASLRADNVDRQTARNVAATYMASLKGDKVVDVNSPRLFKEYYNPATGENALYIFNFDHGYVVVSGSRSTTPVLAYDDQNPLNDADLSDNVAFSDWLQHYADMVSVAQTNELAADRKYESEWASLSESQPIKRFNSKYSNHKLLVKTYWAQSAPYNKFCPNWSGGNKSVVGCVALALGMVLRYWEYPVHPIGSTYTVMASSVNYTIDFDADNVIYNYDLMPNKLIASTPTEQVDEVARFLYHCGPAVNMTYSADGSGTYMDAVSVALERNYKYSGFSFVNRNSYQGDWVELMKKEILSGRPVIYRAQDMGSDATHAGHCFVIAGYNPENNKFRVNWGWGDNATWCDMADIEGLQITLGNDFYKYSAAQGAFINVMPPADSIHIELPDPSLLDIRSDALAEATIEAVYPQPATQQITIPFAIQGASEGVMEIYNVQGQMMDQVRVNAADRKAVISVKDYPSGIYTARLRGASRKFVVK